MTDLNRKYSNKRLQELADLDLIWPKKSTYYRNKLFASIKANKWNVDPEDPDCENNIVHEELWWDVCAIVNDLSQMVLDEREKTEEIKEDLLRTLKDTISQIKKHDPQRT